MSLRDRLPWLHSLDRGHHTRAGPHAASVAGRLLWRLPQQPVPAPLAATGRHATASAPGVAPPATPFVAAHRHRPVPAPRQLGVSDRSTPPARVLLGTMKCQAHTLMNCAMLNPFTEVAHGDSTDLEFDSQQGSLLFPLAVMLNRFLFIFGAYLFPRPFPRTRQPSRVRSRSLHPAGRPPAVQRPFWRNY